MSELISELHALAQRMAAAGETDDQVTVSLAAEEIERLRSEIEMRKEQVTGAAKVIQEVKNDNAKLREERDQLIAYQAELVRELTSCQSNALCKQPNQGGAAVSPEQTAKNLLTAVRDIPTEELLSLDYFKNRGDFFIERALSDHPCGSYELAFSNAIKRFHELSLSTGGGGLFSIIGDDHVALKAALTVFQWLITNVGSSVLDEALEAAGFERTKRKQAKEVQS